MKPALTVALTKARRVSLSAGVYALTVALLIVAPFIIAGDAFYLDLLTRLLIIAIAVASLNLLVGCGGMISLGHAAYLGIGAYSVGIPAFYGIDNGFIHLGLALGCSAAFALITGAVCLRTRGLYFILITLAFSQMLYFTLVSIDQYGADDGLIIDRRSDFGALDLEHPMWFYYAVLTVLFACLFALHRITRARFGRVLFGAKHSEARMQSIGFDAYQYKLVCYVIAGVMCGAAGFLLGNFTHFISPEMMDWTRSAELLFMLVVGGAGALFAPVTGAGAFILLEEFLSGLSVHWHILFGLLLIALVLFAGQGGVDGALQKLDRHRHHRHRHRDGERNKT